MGSTSLAEGMPAGAEPAAKGGTPPRQRVRPPGDGWIYLLLAALTAGSWWLSTLKLFTSKSDFGYWLGVAGGCTMLGVFAYPMRKHLRFMQRWGAGKYWFIVHMSVGVIGPVLILVHSTFTIGSINAGVALFSMVIVALSGVVGRFLYVRLHRGLYGEKLTLDELRRQVGGDGEAVARLHFAPDVQADLRAFEVAVLGAPRPVLQVMLGSPALTLRRWLLQRRCRAALRRQMAVLARDEHWTDADHARRRRRVERLVGDYLRTTQRISEFAAWDRLFSLWHVVHVPFVYLMVLSAVAHVIAVHAY